MSMKKKLSICFLAMIIAVAFFPANTFAASKITTKTYNQVVKSGNTVYCAGPGNALYKVKVKNHKVKSKRLLAKSNFTMGSYSYIHSMKKKGNFMYYVEWTEGTMFYLKRVNLKSGKRSTLAVNATDYAIKGNKLYAEIYNDDTERSTYKVMKLNGKSKKKTSVKPKMIVKRTNAKGYAVKYKKKGSRIYTYLKTPRGCYYLGKVKSEW